MCVQLEMAAAAATTVASNLQRGARKVFVVGVGMTKVRKTEDGS